MTDLVGRKPEIQLLNDLLASKKAELLAVYGRRRIGKTFLIHSYLQDKGLYFEMTGMRTGSTAQQIQLFMQRLLEWVPSLAVSSMPTTWLDAFELFRKAIDKIQTKQRIILFFDELPWMATKRSGFLDAFEALWNRHLSRDKRILMIICGSAVAWMIRKIIRNKGGLHGRLTAQMRLKPFTLQETADYLRSLYVRLEKKQIVELYMVTGGIPKYLSYVKPGLSIPQIIQDLCFSPQGRLTTEFLGLLDSHFEKHQLHQRVIEALANKKMGLNYAQIEKETKIKSGGNLSKVLRELVATDFIQIVNQYGKDKKDCLYRLIDEYSLFYLTWVKKHLHHLDQPISPQFWQQMHTSAQYRTWSGYAFENVVFRHIHQIVDVLQLQVVVRNISYWAIKGQPGQKGAQIDLIIERSDKCIHLCEIKFYDQQFKITESYAETLNKRRDLFREHAKRKLTFFNTLITPHGADHNRHYLGSVDQEITLNQLFGKSE